MLPTKPINSIFRLLLFTFLLVLSANLAGCQPASETPLPVKSSSPIPTRTETPTSTSLPTVPPTIAPSATPVWTPTPSPVVSPTPPACLDPQGTVQSVQASFDFFPKPLRFQLYLPPCYDASAGVRYPLLILLHGQNTDELQWIRLGAAAAADRLISSNQRTPFIMVMPYEEYGMQDPSESSFEKLVIQGLLPWLNQHYNICIERACRAIGGLSRGAAWAVRLGFTHWQQFGKVGAHSLAYFWGDNVMLRQWTRAIPPAQLPILYMDIGDEDRYLPSAAEFEGLLTQFQVPHTWLINQGEHKEEYWRTHVEEYLRWYSLLWKKDAKPDP